MDFDGFLVLIRIETQGIDRAMAPLWELAALAEPGDIPLGAMAGAADELCR